MIKSCSWDFWSNQAVFLGNVWGLNDSHITTSNKVWLTWDYLHIILVRSWRGVFATWKASRWPVLTPRACRWSVEAPWSRAVSSAAWRRSPTSTSISSSLMWWEPRDAHALTLCRCNQGRGWLPSWLMRLLPWCGLHQSSVFISEATIMNCTVPASITSKGVILSTDAAVSEVSLDASS